MGGNQLWGDRRGSENTQRFPAHLWESRTLASSFTLPRQSTDEAVSGVTYEPGDMLGAFPGPGETSEVAP